MELYTKKRLNPIHPAALIAQVDGLSDRARAPFDPISLAALGDLSKKLLSTSPASQAPQLVALGFWLRPSQLSLAAESFAEKLPDMARAKPRGIALHLPPQNVDTLFVYSWALSLLAGNVNITRLPSEMTNVLSWLMSIIAEVLETHGLAETQLFCRYPHSSEMTAQLSALADLRMIWGGDEKIASVSRAAIRPDGLSLGFSDRKSFSVISARAYAAMDEVEREAAAGQLYNDIFWFDQMGCGSPRVIFWLGSAVEVAADLYRRLDSIALRKAYVVETGTALAKFSYMNERIASAQASKGTRFSNRLSVLEAQLDPVLLDKTQGAGLIYEITVQDVSQIGPLLNRQTQTITHLGLSKQELSNLADVMARRGGYRLVPVGQALSFSDIWDGVDLLSHMVRQITVKI